MEPSTHTFDALWDQTHERLCRFVCSRVSNAQDAEDLLQEIYLRVYHQLGTVRDPQRLESWMYQIARHRIIDHYRSRRQWADLSEALAADEEPAEETTEALLPFLLEVVTSLPEPYREALIETDLKGMTQHDLAGRLGLTLSGAKSRVQRARQKVREAMTHCFELEFDTRGSVMDYSQHCCC